MYLFFDTETTGFPQKGVPARSATQARVALDVFLSMSEQADTLIARNKAFDSQMMAIECEALRAEFPKFHEEHCTMLATKNICKLPGRYGDYKWPKLEESLRILCGREIGNDAHDAMVDTKACRDIFFELQNRKEKGAA